LIRVFLGLLDVLLYYDQDNILNNPPNKETHIFLFWVVKFLKLSGALYILIKSVGLSLQIFILHLKLTFYTFTFLRKELFVRKK